jgi:hypothetical protein
MNWQVVFHDQFEPEFAGLAANVQDELLAADDKAGAINGSFINGWLTK